MQKTLETKRSPPVKAHEAALPDFGRPAKESAKATGTDNVTAQDAVGGPRMGEYASIRPVRSRSDVDGEKRAEVGDSSSASSLAWKGPFSCNSSQADVRKGQAGGGNENARISLENQGFSGVTGEGGIRPPGLSESPCRQAVFS